MFYTSLKRVLIILIIKLEEFTLTKRWKVKAVFIYTILSLLLSFPDYDVLIFDNGNQLYKALQEGLQYQRESPFKPIPQNYIHLADGHLNKRAFRLTAPIVAYIFRLNIVGCVALLHLTGILIFYALITLLERFTEDKVIAFVTTIGIACTFTGVWSFYDTLFLMESATFLILAMACTNAWLVGGCIFLPHLQMNVL